MEFRPEIEAKILTSPVTGHRYVVMRHEHEKRHGHRYEYFQIGADDELYHVKSTRAAIREFLQLPMCDVKVIEPYYEHIWNDRIDLPKVDKLRAELTAG